jgi:hypothetical protein
LPNNIRTGSVLFMRRYRFAEPLLVRLLPASLLVLSLVSAISPASDGAMTQTTSRSESGAAVMHAVCGTCHRQPEAMIAGHRKSRTEWERLVEEMVGYGMSITDQEKRVIVDYLATSFGPPDSAPGVASATGDAGSDAARHAAPRVKGTWQLVSAQRQGQPLDRKGYMILTDGYFSRVYEPADSDSVAQAGQYRVESNRLMFTALASAAAARTKGEEAQMRWQGEDLVLTSGGSAGDVEEVWRRVEKF